MRPLIVESFYHYMGPSLTLSDGRANEVWIGEVASLAFSTHSLASYRSNLGWELAGRVKSQSWQSRTGMAEIGDCGIHWTQIKLMLQWQSVT